VSTKAYRIWLPSKRKVKITQTPYRRVQWSHSQGKQTTNIYAIISQDDIKAETQQREKSNAAKKQTEDAEQQIQTEEIESTKEISDRTINKYRTNLKFRKICKHER
jgi:hypothetical protein